MFIGHVSGDAKLDTSVWISGNYKDINLRVICIYIWYLVSDLGEVAKKVSAEKRCTDKDRSGDALPNSITRPLLPSEPP